MLPRPFIKPRVPVRAYPYARLLHKRGRIYIRGRACSLAGGYARHRASPPSPSPPPTSSSSSSSLIFCPLPFKFSRYLPTKEKVEYPGSEQLARDDTLGVEAAPTTILCFWKWLQAIETDWLGSDALLIGSGDHPGKMDEPTIV
ncbi:hypothetical protein ALC56_05702 [Trachymyrmex septentrionalis]|uniref:Uncharacterized protein n=1 Tax=Trachymyrmex septentrionalis TaxID=34720 RepID=A0A195FIX2_9HYME|nr:hypothetical protein ALC56_05702 [Trachymyrmex septentrionalis]